MNKADSKAAKKSAPPKPTAGLQALLKSRRMLVGGGIVLLLALASWVWWPSGRSKDENKLVDGIAINQRAKDAKPLTVLWEPPRSVPCKNEEDVDQYDPTLSADQRTLIFVRGRALKGVTQADLYQVRRTSVTEPWGEPELLPGNINTVDHDEISPELSRDGQWLFFASDRPGGRGRYDIWVSIRDGDVWGVPVNVGPKVNTGYDEIDPAWFLRPDAVADDKAEPRTFDSGLYFSSDRPKSTAAQPKKSRWTGTLRRQAHHVSNDYDIFLSRVDFESDEKETNGKKTPDETESVFSLATLPSAPTSSPALKEAKRLSYVNTTGREGQPSLTPRGDYLYFSSNRQEARGNRKSRTDFDLYRARIYPPEFRVPENVGAPVNTAGDEMDPFLFANGHSLLLSSNGDGGDASYQLYQSRTVFVVPVSVAKESPASETGDVGGLANWFEKYQWWILLLILALLSLLWLLKKFLDEEQRRRLSLMQRCLLSSMMIHLLIAFLLSVWVISEAVYKIIKEQAPEIAVQAGQLAQERMSLNLREQTTRLPQINSVPVPTKQENEREIIIETRTQLPDIEIEAQQATSQSFALQPQQVQPSTVMADTLESVEPQANLEITQTTQVVLLESASPEAQANRQLVAAIQQQQVLKQQPLQMTQVQPMQVRSQSIESQPTQSLTAIEKEAPEDTKRVLTQLEQVQAQSDVQQPIQTTQVVLLESASPEAQANRQLKLAKSNRTATVAVLKETRAGIPLSATVPAPLNSPLRLETAIIKRSSKLDFTAKLLELPGAVEMVKLPDVKLNVGLNLESNPEYDNPMLLRDPEKRKGKIEQLGGSDKTEEAIKRSLDWFTRNQEGDGRWSIGKHGGQKNHDIAATSFAVLCYFGWGIKHNQPGKPDKHQKTVQKALKWLVDNMGKDGDFTNGQGNGMYDQGVATMALAEAYGLTKDPVLKEPLRKSVDFIIKAQNPNHGAWDYKPWHKGPKGNRIDTSVSGWQIMALRSARMAGIKIKERPFQLASKWLDTIGAGQNRGLYGYDSRRYKSDAMVAEGLFAQQLLGTPPSHARMKESINHIASKPPKKGKRDFYYWYYGCLSLYQNQGPAWDEWNARIKPIWLDLQVKNGPNSGSWDHNKGGKHMKEMGRVITTALATLSLEVYYRYLPLYTFGREE
jgi:hypothetical protein